MLIKLNENGSVRACLYESSNILGSIYNKDTKELIITFKRGAQYKYLDVSETDYMRFEIAESQGNVLNTHIKKHTTESIGNVDPLLLTEEINNVKVDEIKSFELLLSKHCDIVSNEIKGGDISLKTLNDLNNVLSKLVDLKNGKN